MGSRGPVPKRATERAGHRAKDDRPDTIAAPGVVKIAPASRDWHRSARRWYRALAKSGQARYFEPSDWEHARLLAELLTLELGRTEMAKCAACDKKAVVVRSPRAAMVNAIFAAMKGLGTTEGDRRRMRIEIERSGEAEPDSDAVTPIERYRSRSASG